MSGDAFFIISGWVFAMLATVFALYQASKDLSIAERTAVLGFAGGAVVIMFLFGL
jgi:hypothetical protein